MRRYRSVVPGRAWLLAVVALLAAGCGRIAGTGSEGAADPPPVLSAAEERALVEKAEELAFFDGEPEPTRSHAVVTTPRALEASGLLGPSPSFPVAPDDEVFLVAMEGEFVGHLAKVPEGEELPKGTGLWFVMDRASLELVAWGIAEEPIDLAPYGTPSPLPIATPIVIEGATPATAE